MNNFSSKEYTKKLNKYLSDLNSYDNGNATKLAVETIFSN